MIRRFGVISFSLILAIGTASATEAAADKTQKKPRVIVLGVNGAEWDFLRPLLIRGGLPNLQKVI